MMLCSNLKYLARMSGGVPDASFMSTLSGPSNFVSMWEIASAGWELPMPSTPNKAAFNGGNTVTSQVRLAPKLLQTSGGTCV